MLVPRVNTNDDEVEIVHWYVKNQEFVEKDREIVDLESSKAVVSIESEASGYILTHGRVGDTVRVGIPLATFYSELSELEAALRGESTSQSNQTSQIHESKAALPVILEEQVSIAEMPQPATISEDGANSKELQAAPKEKATESVQEVEKPSFNFTRFSQSAKEYIERNNLDSSRFEGMGLVSVEVIEEILGLKPSPVPPSSSPQTPPQIESPAANKGSLRSEKVGKSKQIEISLLSAGQAGGINSSLTVQFNSTGIRKTLEEVGSLSGQILPLILFEFSHLIEEHPAFSAYYEAGQIYYYDRVDLGLAIDLGKGLKVPVIRNANLLSPVELLETINNYAIQYLENRLAASDLMGGTVTVTDLSNEGILHFQPLLNQNQSIILGIGGDSSIDGYPMTLTIVFDHRVLAGREVALFINTLKKRLLSYALTNLPKTEQTVKAKNVQCSRCLIDLESLYRKFERDALMHVYLNEQGQTDYICHVCMGILIVETVVEIVSKISGKAPSQVLPEVSLRSLGITSSIEILKIQSALERKFNQKLPLLGDNWTIHKIAAQVGEAKNESVVTNSLPKELNFKRDEPFNGKLNGKNERQVQANLQAIHIGVDIEEVANLPVTLNYRNHEFYQSQFSHEEISYALLKPDPKKHLCGIFCAKEALKKSAPELISLRMDEIIVYHHQGRPLLKTIHDSINLIFDFKLSISHSNHYAVATVLAVGR